MESVPVKSAKDSYAVCIGSDLVARAGRLLKKHGLNGKVCIITQEKVAEFHLKALEKSLRRQGYPTVVHQLPDGEEAKNQKELFAVYRQLVREDFERRDAIIALGGGVVGDLAGFAAATFLRGIAFVNIGTTLLAQVDSSIGGKTAINLEEGKNLVGAFYPPRLVISDVATLATLPDREFRASLGEVVKYGMIKDAELFGFLEKKTGRILKRDTGVLQKIVLDSARIKAGVVSRDEYETKGERMVLNFGHTFGHGIEQALHYTKLLHGEAVSIGMACAARLAVFLKIFSGRDEKRLLQLLESFHLPISPDGLDVSTADILTAMGRDKKKQAGNLRFVLPERIGKVTVRGGIPEKLIKKAIQGVDHET